MVRKQLYIREDQERLLKKRARELGLREAELIRHALDWFLASGEESTTPGAAEAIAEFLNMAKELSITHRFPEDWRFDREALYAEEERWQP